MACNVEATIKGKYLVYRDVPLVREGNTLYYGDMEDKYVLCLMILNDKEITTPEGKKVSVPGTVMGQVWSTNKDLADTDRVKKQFFEDGLAKALDFGISQLERYKRKG